MTNINELLQLCDEELSENDAVMRTVGEVAVSEVVIDRSDKTYEERMATRLANDDKNIF